MTDGPQQDDFPPPPQGPVPRYTPGPAGSPGSLSGSADESGRLTGGTQQAWPTGGTAQGPGTAGPVGTPATTGLGAAPHQPAPFPSAPGHQGFGAPVQQPWPGQAAQARQGPEKSAAPGALALVFGVLGLVVPFLPLPLDHVRSWIAFPFAVVAFALGVVGCIGRRPVKALAVIGMMCATLALVVGVIMVGNRVAAHAAPPSTTASHHAEPAAASV
ncbi:hypothetical protein ACWEOE_13570 [Amycolatopsis sp. NPDC004368]